MVQKITTMPTICMACDMGLGVRAKVFKPKTASHVPTGMPIFCAFSVAVSLLLMVGFLAVWVIGFSGSLKTLFIPNLQNRQKRTLRNLHIPHLFHAFFACLLFF